MANNCSIFKPNIVSIPHQAAMIKKTYESFSVNFSKNNKLIAVGNITPAPLSRVYTVKITYSLGNKPIIEVINPKLKEETKKLPHVYSGNTLCLYYPFSKEWTKYDYIAYKIIPWISMWLYYYELWNITGEWKGGGIHPNKNN